MAKAILMSIKPEWVAKILNGEKTIEIRKRFPKDYVGWVYIYCTKGNDLLLSHDKDKCFGTIGGNYKKCVSKHAFDNGKVVARFWCDKVEEISYEYRYDFTSVYTDTLSTEKLETKACLTRQEFRKYLNGNLGYAIHISKLEIFDEPKDLGEFYTTTLDKNPFKRFMTSYTLDNGLSVKKLTKAPQSWCYVEV